MGVSVGGGGAGWLSGGVCVWKGPGGWGGGAAHEFSAESGGGDPDIEWGGWSGGGSGAGGMADGGFVPGAIAGHGVRSECVGGVAVFPAGDAWGGECWRGFCGGGGGHEVSAEEGSVQRAADGDDHVRDAGVGDSLYGERDGADGDDGDVVQRAGDGDHEHGDSGGGVCGWIGTDECGHAQLHPAGDGGVAAGDGDGSDWECGVGAADTCGVAGFAGGVGGDAVDGGDQQ